MKQYQGISLEGKGSVTVSDKPLGKGGEGAVYSVESHTLKGIPNADELVAKVYYEPKENNRQNKVQAMIQSKPESDSFAWPLAAIGNSSGFQGYLMRKLDSSGFRQWADLSNSRDRRRVSPDFDLKYAITSCRNLAIAISSAHEVDAIIGDVNESNIFIGADASVLIVDTDSAQITAHNGETYPCTVGKPEYTAAELTHGSFKDNPRTVQTDVFAFAVACFQMITGGGHPMDGVFSGNGEPPSTVDKIRKGITPSLSPSRGFKPAPRIASEAIPSRVKDIMIKSLSPDPLKRLTLSEWVFVFDDVVENITHCKKEKLHWYDPRDSRKCPLCKRKSDGKNDPWAYEEAKRPKTASPQSTLPPVGFQSNEQKPLKAPRAAVQPQPAQQVTAPRQQSPVPISQTSNAPSSQSNAQQFQERKAPKTIKGRMVVYYPDGSYGPRPDYPVLFQSNPKLAFKAMKVETPGFAAFWWPNEERIADKIGLAIGFVISIAISLSWLYLVPMIPLKEYVTFVEISSSLESQILYYYSLVATTFGVLASCIFSITALVSKKNKVKKYGNLNSFVHDPTWMTILRYIPVGIVWGPIAIVLILAFLIVWGAMSLITMLVEDGKRR